MLEELSIRSLGPIRSAIIAPAAGMTAITGETGAGKSMLLSALSLISGGPADAKRVSPGADKAWAQGIFALSADDADAADTADGRGGSRGTDGADDADGSDDDGVDAASIARAAGVEPEDDELFLARTVPVSGRSRAVLGGKTVPRSVLAKVAARLVTIHGQAEQLKIASSARQREFLDRVAGDDAELAAYHAAYRALADMDGRLERLRSQESSARQQADYLRESIDRINAVDPHPGEIEELKAKRDRIENAAAIAEGVSHAIGALDPSQLESDSGSDAPGASDLILEAAQALRAIHAAGDFGALADRLESLNDDLGDILFDLTGQLGEDFGETDLDELNARIHDLDELTRRWGPTIGDVIAWRDKAAFDIEDLDASPEKLAELEAERAALHKAALDAAEALSAARATAAGELASRVTSELASLAMDGAALAIRVTPRTASGASGDAGDVTLDAHGGDDIEFLFTAYEGAPERPMGKSASGGELSRLMLALELSAADMRAEHDGGASAADMTFIFDEVDAGVGGKTAVELGRRLARLAATSQVIVVTHLAQVASWADAQFVVTKEPPDADDDAVGVVTTVAEVRDEARVREIARMLSGSESEASLDHARELLKESTL